ncbi:MAG: exodeoxyribonuclease VII large subunit [Oscillospiraceae bacterium]|nr:exodeoxyribonuclease VII large subunit [Candidatus Equicaccousia limihippi]
MLNTAPLTVKQLNTYIKSVFEGDRRLNFVIVKGEISSLRRYSSGHVYFTLKDGETSLKAVMFSFAASKLPVLPKEGDSVICSGKVTVYERDGVYQLVCETMTSDGVGELAVQFEMLKLKLYSEGLFADEHKKAIPVFPEKIALVTSPDGAAVHDFITVASRRFPMCEIVIYGSLVQGEAAPQSLIKALQSADKDNNDVIVITRGGGSKEDLSAFNDEALAHAVFSANTPVISAVGHEIDFSICDFVADKRCPTPSAAAEQLLPDISDISRYFTDTKTRLTQNFVKIIELNSLKLSQYKNRDIFLSPLKTYSVYEQKLKDYSVLINNLYNTAIERADAAVKKSKAQLVALDPNKVLSRGYSVIYNQGKAVINPSQIKENDRLFVKTYNGNIDFTVKDIKTGDNNG